MRNLSLAALALVALSSAAPNVFALESDRDQQMNIDANYMKSASGERDNADKPSIDQLDGNVVVVQGSMKARGDHATIYRNAQGVVDASGKKGALTRVLLTGKQAYMEQVHDGDCMLITSNANTIDFHNDTNTAILTGGVVVNQKGKGEFRGEHMVYNTKTGEMESGSTTPQAGAPRVHVTLEPKSDAPAATNTNNCGFPLGSHVPKAEKKSEPKPAGKS